MEWDGRPFATGLPQKQKAWKAWLTTRTAHEYYNDTNVPTF
jgi:hypothetical protein